MVTCVIPAFKSEKSIVSVVSAALQFVDHVIVVDDQCPEKAGDLVQRVFAGDARVDVIVLARNRGVGGAMKAGMARALEAGAQFIVKVDSDGQMDPAFIPDMIRVLRAKPHVALVKGNRFIDSSVTRVMPPVRLFGNSVLTLLVRIATGFWSSVDPTNGFVAIRASSLRRIRLANLSDRYYFEISLLAALGMRKAEIAEIDMPAIYTDHPSSLSIWKTALAFPGKLASTFVKRIVWQYLINDMNVASVMLIVGAFLVTTSIVYGGYCWAEALATGLPRTPGTVMLAFLPFITGFQLLVNALMYDVQCASTVHKFNSAEDVVPAMIRERRRFVS